MLSHWLSSKSLCTTVGQVFIRNCSLREYEFQGNHERRVGMSLGCNVDEYSGCNCRPSVQIVQTFAFLRRGRRRAWEEVLDVRGGSTCLAFLIRRLSSKERPDKAAVRTYNKNHTTDFNIFDIFGNWIFLCHSSYLISVPLIFFKKTGTQIKYI